MVITKKDKTGVRRDSKSARSDRQILALLFMDLAGWSSQDPRDVVAYLRIAAPRLDVLLKAGGAKMVNTWGDAVVATFASPLPASETALRIRDLFRETADSRGVAAGLSPRTALHVGDVIIYHNPITGRDDFTGDAVNRCARVEPITPPGYVFCTEAFATMLASDLRDTGPVARALGLRALPKYAGEELVHVVTWPGEPDPRMLIEARDQVASPSIGATSTTTALDIVITAPTAESPTPGECAALVDLYWVGLGPVVWVNPERTPGIDAIIFHVNNRLAVDVKVDIAAPSAAPAAAPSGPPSDPRAVRPARVAMPSQSFPVGSLARTTFTLQEGADSASGVSRLARPDGVVHRTRLVDEEREADRISAADLRYGRHSSLG